MAARERNFKETAVPLAILSLFVLGWAIGWGPHFVESAYIPLRYAQNLSTGLGLTYNPAGDVIEPVLSGFLDVFVLALGQRLGLPILPSALFLSALGWIGQMLIIYNLAGQIIPENTRWFPVVLLAFAPVFSHSLGTAVPWMLAWAWLTILLYTMAIGDGKMWAWLRPLTLLLLLVTQFNLETLALALILIGVSVTVEKRLPWHETIIVIAATSLWIVAASRKQWPLVEFARLNFQAVPDQLRHLGQKSELYVLFLPFLFWGGWTLWQKGRRMLLAALLGWLLFAGLTGNVIAVVIILLFLTGIGAADLFSKMTKQMNLSIRQRMVGSGLALGLVLLPLLTSLVNQVWTRPFTQQQLTQEIATWIQADASPEASLLAPQPIAFLTGLPAVPVIQETFTDKDYQTYLLEQRPDYFVLTDSADWLRMTQLGWFREQYAPLQVFPWPIQAEPTIVWGSRNSVYYPGQRDLMQVNSPAGIELVGAQFEGQIATAEQIATTIFLRSRWPLLEPFVAQLNLNAAADGQSFAHKSQSIPTEISLAAWQSGKIISETLSINLPDDLPYGAYSVNVSFAEAGAAETWPLFQDDDKNALDQALLGYVAVPWQTAVSDTITIQATFGGQIRLNAYAYTADWQRGETASLTLFWEAVELPAQTYFVFIHLFDEAGNLVVNINERPTQGEFPMAAWFPGTIIRDEWAIPLPVDLMPGVYQVQMGLFDLASGERLPLRDLSGQAVGSRSLPLMEVTIHE